MNNPSPLIPQGSLLDQKNKSRARVRIAVFLVLAIHGIGLLALLMQGCKKEPEAGSQGADATNNPAMSFVEPTNTPPAATNDAAAMASNVPPPVVETHPQVPVVPPAAAAEYTIASGDNLSAIAKKFHVTVKAIEDANPGIEPTKLKIGQKINIPAATATVAQGTLAGGSNTAADATSGEQTYSVKSGDSLSKIATQFGTTVKAIRSLNNLKTDKIVVGQKLKIPAKTSAPTAPAPSTSTTPTGQ